MKGLAATVNSTLESVVNGTFSQYGGKVANLGLVSGDDPSLNYVQLPTDTWTMTNFTVEDYNALVAAMVDGTGSVSNDIDNQPKTEIKVNTFDNIH
jgi:basic membrane protein A